MNDGDTFSIDDAPGYTFKLRVESDEDAGPPWERSERSDGHGPVRSIRTPYGMHHQDLKRPGERVMGNGRGDYWLYDWQKACQLAREDGWNAEPYDAPNRIERAVQADFDFLRRWLRDDWRYVGVCVQLLDDEGEPTTERYEYALWGIESDCTEYIEEVARELAHECASAHELLISQRRVAWRAALAERRERTYWESRGVATSL